MRGRPNLYTDYSKESAIFSNNTQKVWFTLLFMSTHCLYVNNVGGDQKCGNAVAKTSFGHPIFFLDVQ